MRASIFICVVSVVALTAASASASVFSGSGSSALQSTFSRLGYDYIDVANYQTNLNFSMQGMMEFELLSKNSSFTGFGVLETVSSRWGRYHQHHRLFRGSNEVGSTRLFDMSGRRSSYGFYIEQRSRFWTQRYYSYSPFNRYGSVQALFYENPTNSGEYLIAFEGSYAGSSHSDKSYDDVVLRMRRVHAVPEPTTWVLFASGLLGIGVFARTRRKSTHTG